MNSLSHYDVQVFDFTGNAKCRLIWLLNALKFVTPPAPMRFLAPGQIDMAAQRLEVCDA